jgi:hypothetical protein
MDPVVVSANGRTFKLWTNPSFSDEIIGSDFLQSFVGRLTVKDKVFLTNLLNQRWNWVDSYIHVTGWLNSFRERMRL